METVEIERQFRRCEHRHFEISETEHRQRVCEYTVYLDGARAEVWGWKDDRATVRTVDGLKEAAFDWSTVYAVVTGTNNFLTGETA